MSVFKLVNIEESAECLELVSQVLVLLWLTPVEATAEGFSPLRDVATSQLMNAAYSS
ncbi:hypothetical protein [Scytonema hofmannii]|uniref:hypothetical protein n=1 Tax=Scytonema hofmannii TaxID=34078 RepID=UPI00234F2BC3|nr:hypothetical protein [Scytonema hofmannii]